MTTLLEINKNAQTWLIVQQILTILYDSMHFFDPSLSWPADLLKTPPPDMLIIRSDKLDLSGYPWQQTQKSSIPWSHYVAPKEEDTFIHMLFLQAQSSRLDYDNMSRFLQYHADNGDKVLQYHLHLPVLRSSSVLNGEHLARQFLDSLLEGRLPVIVCHFTGADGTRNELGGPSEVLYSLDETTRLAAGHDASWHNLKVKAYTMDVYDSSDGDGSRFGEAIKAMDEVNSSSDFTASKSALHDLKLFIVASAGHAKHSSV